ncbi:short-chain dehydrogenase, putative [Talaromyces stipitatus ATCC 10500]|uniref:Short-chain dehydrogenase, putative n=1 Tax=Talaromyces stipitatus (strain ATCC 10500 / CBS 375.48 / QM 6759 / NRRL 1006) TaxID=441959 RepID=B8M142_TALSN|nr:short-chain dehydrogenase, putative [Talaromyces stipitatus ATCC 10500]EED20984.1 short-chain dehydrogenase, putative [Talaromyces stipitatus ATCC 10500]
MAPGKKSHPYQKHTSKKRLPPETKTNTHQRFREFDLQGKVFVVTGGRRGLGLAMAEALVEEDAQIHCVDRLPEPDDEFRKAQKRANPAVGGSLHYRRIGVRDAENVAKTFGEIGELNKRFDGILCAAGVNHVDKAVEHTPKEVDEVMSINYTGVFICATEAAKQMMKYRCRGAILLVASMGGFIANKGMASPVYNSSKAAVIQLTRINEKGEGGIRVNCLCPGHIMTPMVQMVFDKEPETKELWQSENMMGRLANPEEFRGAALFLLSEASSFMTGASLVIDGGHTAW